ncbi:MAG: 30S ribosomal protein S19e [Candidatus Bathyarchaeia archaeon]
MPTAFEVSPEALIKRLASYLKENVEEVAPPSWAMFAKTSSAKEHPPQDPDWWYTRCASLLRKLYVHGPVGVSRLRKEYGARKRRGRRPEHTAKGGGSSIREPLQQLEKAGLVEKANKAGRRITAEGQRLLDRLSSELLAEKTVKSAARVS